MFITFYKTSKFTIKLGTNCQGNKIMLNYLYFYNEEPLQYDDKGNLDLDLILKTLVPTTCCLTQHINAIFAGKIGYCIYFMLTLIFFPLLMHGMMLGVLSSCFLLP